MGERKAGSPKHSNVSKLPKLTMLRDDPLQKVNDKKNISN
jgi:hypothetical protein